MDWESRLIRTGALGPPPPGGAAGLADVLDRLVVQQEAAWPELRRARDAWFACRYRDVPLGDFRVRLAYNPAREASVAAQVDSASIRQRPCFLCPAQMPPPERGLPVDDAFALFLNPYPIFYPHPVVIHRDHRPQVLADCLPAMFPLARRLAGRYSLLYNGPRCGASAPDHLHFQAIPRYSTAIEADVHHLAESARSVFRNELALFGEADAFTIDGYGRTAIFLESAREAGLRRALDELLRRLPADGAGPEPLVNLLVWFGSGRWTVCLFPRRRHRPSNYAVAPGEGVLVSPGSIDLAGMIITPRRMDFEALDASAIRAIFGEVCLPLAAVAGLEAAGGRPVPRLTTAGPEMGLPAAEPVLRVGLVEGRTEVAVSLADGWRHAGRLVPAGDYTARPAAGSVRLVGERASFASGDSLVLDPQNATTDRFGLHGVTIGVDFHWQRQESQRFAGALELVPDGAGTLAAVNRVPLESYLEAVIASEMRADAPLEFLKAHAVISRSWALAQLAARARPGHLAAAAYPPLPGRRWGWTDRSRHERFDLCADDHCQRYQGLERAARPVVAQAVAETRGLVLTAGGGVLDARFAKCCGGMSEAFASAWGDVTVAGLEPVRCAPDASAPDLTVEAAAADWIRGEPEAWCRTRDPAVLGRILPDFDLETGAFFRWTVIVARGELEEIIRAKTGWDPGELLELVPVQRGHSGRLVQLLLVGTRGRLLLGKELEIRRALSPSHLYSSAFVADAEGGAGGPPERFRFRGAGWGHGVGLCQVGAAVMAVRGARHEDILAHFYRGAVLTRLYR
jgi:peptidoglycan hydrolase-like amidase/diadenosine tetraphosphate (Ap4A) HIT family hydrolase